MDAGRLAGVDKKNHLSYLDGAAAPRFRRARSRENRLEGVRRSPIRLPIPRSRTRDRRVSVPRGPTAAAAVSAAAAAVTAAAAAVSAAAAAVTAAAAAAAAAAAPSPAAAASAAAPER